MGQQSQLQLLRLLALQVLPQAPHQLSQHLQLKPQALEPVKQPPLLARVVFLVGVFLGMTALQQPLQGKLPPPPPQCQPPLLARVVCLVGDFLGMTAQQRPLQGSLPPPPPQCQPPLLARVVFLAGDFLEMSVILQRQAQQPQLTQQLLVRAAFWVGVSLVVDVTQKQQQPPQQRQQLPPQLQLQLPQPNVEVLLVVVYWAAKHLIQCHSEQVLFKTSKD